MQRREPARQLGGDDERRRSPPRPRARAVSSIPYSAPRSESSYVERARARSGTPRSACRPPRLRRLTLRRARRARLRSLAGRGPTTTPSSVATAARSPAAANPTRPEATGSPSRQGTETPVTSTGAAGSASSSVSSRESSPRNSKRRKNSFSCERSGGASTSWQGSKSSSRSRRIVASSFESRACSACSVTALERAGVSSPACSITASSDPKRTMSSPAVLSPIPGCRGCCRMCRP